jgi:type II secretory pathway pseudopilin PulG
MIELLVVIAIIAILTAILFPVFGRIREGARQTTCFSNMHQIQVAMAMYRNDHGDYPPMLLGPAENPNGSFHVNGSGTAVAMNKMQYGYLFPNYVKSPDVFRCPDNPVRDLTKTTQAYFPTNSAWRTLLALGQPTYGAGLGYLGAPAALNGTPVSFYQADSYDITGEIDSTGKRISGPAGPNFLLAYAKDWTAHQVQNLPAGQDATFQLKYKNPPLDRTVLTYCTYHVAVAGADLVPVMLASGTAKRAQYREIVTKTYRAFAN